MRLVTASEMRDIDRLTIESYGLPGRILMENAGRGAAAALSRRFAKEACRRIGIMAGRGNNGGDGFVIARYLKAKGLSAAVYLLSRRSAVRGEDAAANLALLDPIDVPVYEISDEASLSRHSADMRRHTLWVDAILGTGLRSGVRGLYAKAVEQLNQSGKPIFSVDIPSGLDSDTGRPLGSCIRADATATFGFAKCAHFLYPGAELTGSLDIIDIGIPAHVAESVPPRQFRLSQSRLKHTWPSRRADTHKGSAGHLLVIAGSPGKTGAAAMAAMSALRSGAGLVTLGVPERIHSVLEGQVLEAMTVPLPEAADGILGLAAMESVEQLLPGKKCLAIGPGLGFPDVTGGLVRRIIAGGSLPMVIDADGLNGLAGHTDLLRTAGAPIVMTPHPGEMARLSGQPVSHIQADRIGTARRFAEQNRVHLVLKGAGTVIAHPGGDVYINTTGNPGMASGGMGDVLTGIIAGLITQGHAIETAVHTGVYLHGRAADSLAASRGRVGYLASEVMRRIPEEIERLRA